MPIKVISVRIIQTAKNFEQTFAALFLFDSIVTDGDFNYGMKIPDNFIVSIGNLFDLDGLAASKNDPYIKNMVSSYCRRKKKIIINIYGLSKIASALSGFVFEGEVKKEETGDDDWNYEIEGRSTKNMVHPSVISLLPNASTIIIKTDWLGYSDYSYPFSMSKFLSVISSLSSWTNIKVQQWVKTGDYEKSWIHKVWDRYSSEIIKEYFEKGSKISYSEDKERNIVYFNIETL